MGWFIPLGVLIGLLGTRTALQSRRGPRDGGQDRSWWLLLVLAWLPALCWLLAQIVIQD